VDIHSIRVKENLCLYFFITTFFHRLIHSIQRHEAFTLAYFPILALTQRLTHHLPTFSGVFDEYVDFGDKTFACGDRGALFWVQERLAQSLKIRPVFSLGCFNGKVSLAPMRETPKLLDELLNPENITTSKKF